MRFQADLQHALDSSVRPRHSGESDRSAPFVPSPDYTPSDSSLELKRPSVSSHLSSLRPNSPQPPARRPPTPSAEDHNIALIRDTLYSALADCIVSTPSIVALLSRGPEWASRRAYFASTSLAILEVALTRVTPSGVRAVDFGRSSPRVIGAAETPEYLRPFLGQLMEVAQAAQEMAEEDDERVMKEAAEGELMSVPKMERLRERLEKGAGEGDSVGRTTSVDGSVAALANAINQLAIGELSLVEMGHTELTRHVRRDGQFSSVPGSTGE